MDKIGAIPIVKGIPHRLLAQGLGACIADNPNVQRRGSAGQGVRAEITARIKAGQRLGRRADIIKVQRIRREVR